MVLPETRFAFAKPLMEMHHDRKRVFVDRFGWRLPAEGSWLEVDQYDNGEAVYLLALSSAGRHLGSVRLLPSSRPHMLSELFNHLCPGGVPDGDDCWEISRLVASPAGSGNGMAVLRIHRLLALGLVEFAAMAGITRFTLVAESARVPVLLSVGWHVVPLGLPTLTRGELLQALQIEIAAGTLAAMRRRLRMHSPVLRMPEPLGRAA